MTDAPADAIIDLYQRHAAAWDAARGRGLFEQAWLDRLLGLLPPGGRVLDIGCGAGEPIAKYVIDRGFALTGVDSAPAMIERCVMRFPEAAFHVADMRTLALGETFDGLIAWDSFFHLTRDAQRAMFAVFEAHAAPGAALLFTSGPSDAEAIGTFEGEPLYHASLDAAEYERLLAEHGFEKLSMVADDPGCGGHTVWLARKRQ